MLLSTLPHFMCHCIRKDVKFKAFFFQQIKSNHLISGIVMQQALCCDYRYFKVQSEGLSQTCFILSYQNLKISSIALHETSFLFLTTPMFLFILSASHNSKNVFAFFLLLKNQFQMLISSKNTLTFVPFKSDERCSHHSPSIITFARTSFSHYPYHNYVVSIQKRNSAKKSICRLKHKHKQ